MREGSELFSKAILFNLFEQVRAKSDSNTEHLAIIKKMYKGRSITVGDLKKYKLLSVQILKARTVTGSIQPFLSQQTGRSIHQIIPCASDSHNTGELL